VSEPRGRTVIGISGWRYAGWRGSFYPKGLAQRRELEYVGERLDSVEVNGTFYSLQRPESFRRWQTEVPPGFVFAVKGGRYITHMLRLRGVEGALANYFAQGVLALGDGLGPVLWQLPERVAFDADELGAFFALLPRTLGEARALAQHHDARLDGRAWLELGDPSPAAHDADDDFDRGSTHPVAAVDPARPIEHCLEVRHPSFESDAAMQALRDAGVGLVIADTAGRFPEPREVTSGIVYIRLHGAEELYTSGYDDALLERWARDIDGWRTGATTPDGKPREVYAYFDNDVKAHAPFDAMRLRELLR
jgi:uncharacterized protein YecE (DUF72 family)